MNNKFNKKRGQVMLLLTMLFAAVSLTILFGTVSPVVRELQSARELYSSKKSYFAAEGGSEDAFYRLKNNINISFPFNLSIDSASTTITLDNISGNEQQITSQALVDNDYRTVLKNITNNNSIDFNFALQSGNGGISMQNGASVTGDVYSNGAIVSNNSNPNSYNLVRGSIISAGANGLVNQIHSTSTVYAHTISNSTIDGNAYYQTLTNSTVSGTKFPNSADQATFTMPITDDQISTWESDAQAGGTISSPCPYNISSSTSTGPKIINCDVNMSGNSTTVTLNGALWIKGNLNIQNNVKVKVADSIGNQSVPVIVDKPSNQLTSSKVTMSNNTEYYGATGQANSYVFVISQNNSAENGGNELAMDIQNGATGNLLVYAPHGEIKLSNNVALKAVTAYQITLINSAQAIYNIGLSQPLFVSGSQGAWKIKSWKEI